MRKDKKSPKKSAKKARVKSVNPVKHKDKTLVEKCYEFAKTLNPDSRFVDSKYNVQELTFFPLNYAADKIIILAQKIGDKTIIDGSRFLRSDKYPFLMIETSNSETIKAAEKICLAVLKGN